MFSTKLRGHEPCYVILLVLSGCNYVFARPQGDPRVHVHGQSESSGSALRYSPELLLENTLESAASPASIYPHFPPSAVSGSNSPATAQDAIPNNKGNNFGNNNDLSLVNSDHDHRENSVVGNVNSQGGLRGPEINTVNNNNNIGQGWSGGARGVSSNGYVGNTGLRPGQQHDGLHDSNRSGPTSSGQSPQSQGVPKSATAASVQNKIAENQLMDDTPMNGLQTADNAPPSQPAVILGQKSPALPEIRQQNAPLGSMYPSFLNAGNKSPEIHQDVDVDGLHSAGQPLSPSEEDLGLPPFLRERPPPPQPFQPSPQKASVSDDGVPGASNQAIPWQQVLSSDIDVDGPVNQPPPAQGTIPGKEERPGVPSPSLGQDDLSDDAFAIEVVLDLDSDENPFREEEENMTGEVPLELALQVIQAMKAEPAWKQYIGSGWEEMEPYWEDDEYDDDYDEDEEYYDYDEEESDEYDDWIPAGNMSPQNSRLITLIIETIGVTEREDDTRDDDMDIWQILTNFPFSMLLGKHNVNEDEYYSEEYDADEYYDGYDDEYDDDYDTEDEYDEYYDDEDSYDDEDYDDSYDDDDEDDEEYSVGLEDNRATFLKKETDNESDEDDYYDDDCDDGTLCDDDNNVKKKDDFTVFSLPPMITKK